MLRCQGITRPARFTWPIYGESVSSLAGGVRQLDLLRNPPNHRRNTCETFCIAAIWLACPSPCGMMSHGMIWCSMMRPAAKLVCARQWVNGIHNYSERLAWLALGPCGGPSQYLSPADELDECQNNKNSRESSAPDSRSKSR